MKIRSVNVSDSDKKSARVFFDALTNMFEFTSALDMFARDGALTVSSYAPKVPDLHLWELCGEHLPALQRFNPAEVRIGCSYQAMLEATGTHDLIVIDSPQGIHSDWQGTTHIEHFFALAGIGKFVADRAVVVLYVNKKPYNRDNAGDHGYDQYEEYDFKAWMAARRTFYSHSPYKLTDAVAIHAYAREFGFMGFDVVNTLVVPCYSDVPRKESYAFRLAVELVKRRP